MRILVIGSGFLATPIVHRLETEGHELLIYTRTPNARIQSQQIVGDIFDFGEFIKVFAWKPQIVIHTAWITAPGLYRDDLSNLKYAQFTTKLAKLMAHSDVEHLIILGTCAEYGFQSGPSTAQITKLSPTTLYAEQKVAAFNEVRKILQGLAIRLTWARVFYPYGPNQNQKRLIPQIIHALSNGEPIMLADITSVRDWITTRDIASAILWVIKNNALLEIDIGTTFGYTNLELLGILEKKLLATRQFYQHGIQNLGLNEVSVVGKNSPLFTSGWLPMDSLSTGLDWMLGS